MNELGKAQKKLQQEADKLDSLENEFMSTVKQMNRRLCKGAKVSELKNVNNYIASINKKTDLQKEMVKKETQLVDKIREELLLTVKDRKILDKLKDRNLETYLLEQKRFEQKTAEEITGFRRCE